MLFAASTHIMQNDIHLLSLVEFNTAKTVTTAAEERISILTTLLFVDQASIVFLRCPNLLPDYLYEELPMLSVRSHASSALQVLNEYKAFYSTMPPECFALVARSVSTLYIRQSLEYVSEWPDDGCCMFSSLSYDI